MCVEADSTECPRCGCELDVKLGWHNYEEVFECPDCGASLVVLVDEYINDMLDDNVTVFCFAEWIPDGEDKY